MAKIGTAHVEIKPVLDEAALNAITDRIAQQVEDAVAEGMARGARRGAGSVHDWARLAAAAGD